MARRSQCSSAGDNPQDPNYLPPHYREEYRLAIDALVEDDLEGYYQFLQRADVVDFLSTSEIQYIQRCLQTPQQSHHPEHPERFLETGGDGSSDTYWPVHSDQDVPDLDLGWPHQHHFIGPTEVTTLVNPPEPDMPSIKDQARRLVKNAQQVIAVVMDMFTDVDMFADILNAAMRNVPVYILLDEQNAHHFFNMVSNCRVDLQSIQFLRVRTVSGITYQCRSGSSFKGQMMDRFLLTDCRAVLSGNYSFMWSYEKLHRSMAHLFLGQLVTTFDEEFRILFAQSKPLMIENMLLAMEEYNLAQKRQYPGDRAPPYKDSRRYLEAGHPEEWQRHSYDERMDVDWRRMKQEPLHGPSDMYNRPPFQQPHMDPLFDQGPSRIPMMENAAFRRYSYAEGGPGRPYSFQQGVPEPESQRRQVPRGQQLYPGPGPGPEADYGGGEKFWSQGYHSADEHFEPQEMQPPQNFDHVLNYISSTRNLDFEQSSDKVTPAADLPFSSSHPRRQSLGQPYACQTSPTHSNPTDQKQFFPDTNVDRKDPRVKRGLRDWRITSYLSAYDNPDEEDLLSAPPQAPEPVEEPAYPIQQTAPATDLLFPKIPNVREFKVKALPRASQIPGYAKISTWEPPKKLPDESAAVAAETKTTPTPSESSSTHEGEKAEEAEQKEQIEPKTSGFRREDSFRRKYNPATPRSSRLRSSLIFSSLELASQDAKTSPGQQDEESEKNEEEQKKLPFVSQVLGQRRSATRNWNRYMKSVTPDNSASETLKPDGGGSKSDDKDPSQEESLKDRPDKGEEQETVKPPDVEQTTVSAPVPQSKPTKAELPKMNQPAQPAEPLFTAPLYMDMSDPDVRLMFFKELAAKRKAAKAAEAKRSSDKSVDPSTDAKQGATVKMKEPGPEETSEKTAGSKTAEAGSVKDKPALTPPADPVNKTTDKAEQPKEKDAAEEMTKPSSCDSLDTDMVAGKAESARACELSSDTTNSFIKNEHSSEDRETRDSSETAKLDQSATSPAACDEVKAPGEAMMSSAGVKENSPRHPASPTNATAANEPSLVQGTDDSESLSPGSTSKDFTSPAPASAEVHSAAASDALEPETQSPESVQSESVVSSPPPPPPPEQHTGSEVACSDPNELQGSSSDPVPPASSSSVSLPSSGPDCRTTPPETVLSNVPPDECSSPSTSVLLPLRSDSTEAQESDGPSLPEPLRSQTSAESESARVLPDPVCRVASPEASDVQVIHIEHVESDICLDTRAAGSDANTSSSQSTTKFEESSASTHSEKDPITLENNSDEKAVVDEPQIPEGSEDVKADPMPPDLISSVPSLPDVSDDQNENMKPTLDKPDPRPEHPTCRPVLPVLSGTDTIPDASQPEVTASPQDAATQLVPPSELNLTDTNAPAAAAEAFPSSPSPAESAASVLSPASENKEINVSVAHGSSDATSDTTEPDPEPPKVPAQPELCKTPDSTPAESQPSQLPAEDGAVDDQSEISRDSEFPDPGEKPAEDTEATNRINKMITEEAMSSEKIKVPTGQNNCSGPAVEITAEEAVPLSPKSKQPKSSQSRYHSSTANVLSSSNLRDDTKLLLEQISANSQSRNEATKDPPVTDDEKEDEADKNAKREKARGIKSPGRAQPKSAQEREKVLERIQIMRKERKVYSRFEV